MDLRQAKLGLCTTKDETDLLTGCLKHSIVHVSLLVCPLCCVFGACLHFWCDATKGRSTLYGGDVISDFKVHSSWCQCWWVGLF